MFAANNTVNFYDTYGQPVVENNMAIPEGTTAATVLEDYVNAIGGAEKLATVTDLAMTMSTTVQGMALEMMSMQKAPNKFAMKVSAGGMVMQEQKYDGVKGMSSQMGQKTSLEGSDLESMKMQAMLFPEGKYASLGYKLELKGIETIETLEGKKSAYQIEVESPSGRKVTEYYDVESSLKVRTVMVEGESTIIQDFTNYEEIDGIKMPYAMKMSGAMPMPITLTVKSIDVNKGIEDAMFTVE